SPIYRTSIAPSWRHYSAIIGRIVRFDIAVQDAEEFLDDPLPAERLAQLAIDVHRGSWLLEGSGKRNADVGVLRLAWPIHHASHDRDPHLLHAGARGAPDRHLFPEIRLDVLGHFLKERARGAPAPGARGDLGRERPELQRLQNLLR